MRFYGQHFAHIGRNYDQNPNQMAGMAERLATAHVFTFDGETELALQNTTANPLEQLPFDECFLDAQLGVRAGDFLAYVHGIAVGTSFGPEPNKKRYMASVQIQSSKVGPYTIYLMHTLTPKFNPVFDVSVAGGLQLTLADHDRDMSKVHRVVVPFVAAWQNLLFDPEVEIVEVQKSVGARKRIERKHGHCPPRINQIRVTGRLKEYLREQSALVKRSGDIRMHWVRGHFRHLTAERFTNKRGQRIWIPPHIRGSSGPLVRSEYLMSGKS